MSSSALVTQENNTLTISGPLDFTTVTRVWTESLPFLAPRTDIQINLAPVTDANSAGLVLLLEWLKYAKNTDKKISFVGIPSQLMTVATVVNIDGLFKGVHKEKE